MMKSPTALVLLFLLGAFSIGQASQQAPSGEAPPVGYPAKTDEIKISGSLLRSTNIATRDQAIVVRVLNSFPMKDGFRYEFEYYGLEPGEYNLADYLERADGTELGELPEIKVKIVPLLPPGQIEPNRLEYQSSFFRDYYLPILVAGGVVWLAGLWLLLFAGRGRFRRLDPDRHRVTVAQRIRPLVEKAVNGELSREEQGELERTLVAFWQKKLRLQESSPGNLMTQLRANKESGELFQQLENWLHRPDPPENVDIATLMKPYQSMNMDEIE